MKRKTTEEFKKEVYDLVGNEYTVLGEYIRANIKIKMRHNKCGNEYEVRPNSFLIGIRCPICANETRKTKTRWDTNLFKEKVKELVGDEYEVLGNYIKAHTKIKMRHNECGNEYEVRPNNFLRGRRCPVCAYKNRKSNYKKLLYKGDKNKND